MKLTLVKKVVEAKDTKSFFFESDEKIIFNAGQYLYITLSKLNYPDKRGETRHFTISSSPSEGKQIRVTMRMRNESGYKKTLDELPIGSIVEGRGPQGFFVFNENSDPSTSYVFIAGGIGITPFRSIIKNNIDSNLNVPIHLIYSNSDSEFIFKKEFDEWQQNDKNLKITFFDSSVSGHLDEQKITSLISSDIKSNIYYVVGPNVFVNAMEDILEKIGVMEKSIKTEKFTGY